MKIFLLLTALVAFSSAAEAANEVLTADLNNYVDEFISLLQNFIRESGYDPLDIPDVLEELSVKWLLITYKGELGLKDGLLYNLATVRRTGNVILSYNKPNVTLAGSVGADLVTFYYHYVAQIMGLGPSGGILGTATRLVTDTDISFDTEAYYINLNKFEVSNIRSVSVQLDGDSVIDVIANSISTVATSIFRNQIMDFLEEQVTSGLNKFFDSLNADMAASNNRNLHSTGATDH